MRPAYLTALLVLACPLLLSAGQQNALKKGTPDIKVAGPLAFGPDGVLFIGDPQSAAIFAVDTGDTSGSSVSVNVEDVKGKVASLLGAKADEVTINDVAVNPISGKVYLSVSRGTGPDAMPVVLTVDGKGKLAELALKDIPFAKAELPNPPADKVTGEGRRAANQRRESITDMAFIDGRIVVAGLSNEEFASNLREIPYPFDKVNTGAAIEIYHGAHGAVETRSPIRTFIPMTIGGKPSIVAAYTCTPLVRIPLEEVKTGNKVRGTTVAELGNRNRPLDIISYEKDGKSYLLMANSARGVMKIGTDQLATEESISERVADKAGQTYETVESLTGVVQLDKLNDDAAVLLVEKDGQQSLQTVPLP